MPKKTKPWEASWEEVQALGKGGQGRTVLVRKRDGADPTLKVLKVLNRQDDPERRRRLHREVAALETIVHDRVPKVVESNASDFRDPSIPLYIVMDYVKGQTLEELVGAGTLDLAIAKQLIRELLDALECCHASGLVHRDIKPDNIVVADGGSPFLVDWGLSYGAEDAGSFETGSKELGNRFLHLPELQEGSQKRAEVSDLTQTVGLLFYAITGCIPRVLIDARGQLPHQRPDAASYLANLASKERNGLFAIFERGFDTIAERRFGTVEQLRNALDALPTGAHKDEAEADEAMLIRDMKHRLTGSHKYGASVDLARTLGFVHDAIAEVFHDVARYAFEELLVHFPWGHVVDVYGTPPRLESSWGLQRKIDGRTTIQAKFEATVLGTDIVLSAQIYDDKTNSFVTGTEATICRQSIGDLPDAEESQRPLLRGPVGAAVRKYLIAQMAQHGDFAPNSRFG